MKYAAQAKYDKANTKTVTLKLNIKTDEDIIQWLEAHPNRQGAVKDAIRKMINRDK